METRKLQLIGGGASYGVSLPKQWVEARGLAAGDELTIAAMPSGELRLLAGPPPPVPRRHRELPLTSSDPDEILRSILGAYIAGFDTATLSYSGCDPAAVRTAVGEACARLHGVQIVEDDRNRLVLEDLAGTEGLGPEKSLRRMQAIALQMLNNVVRMTEGGQEAITQENTRYEAEIDRLLLFMLKQYGGTARRSGTGDPGAQAMRALHGMFVAHFLERIGDYVVRISTMAQTMGVSAGGELAVPVRDAAKEVAGIVADALRAFNNGDVPLANQVIRRAMAYSPSDVRDSVIDAFTSPRSKPQLPSCVRCLKFFSLLESLERVALYAKSIAETAIDAAMADSGGNGKAP